MMRRLTLIPLALLLFAGATVQAQDSFGGQPAAPPTQPEPQPQARPTAPANAASTARLDRLMVREREDFGVAATDELHAGPMHAPTPASIPGGQVITTKGLIPLLANAELGALVFDILGGEDMIPGARPATPASQGGSFTDRTQQEFGNYLQSVTNGNKEVPLVFYCLSNHCWMSYNASLRAIHMGYRNVLWYRGGIDAWKAAGQPVQTAGQGPK